MPSPQRRHKQQSRPQDYEAHWSAWERAVSPAEVSIRAKVVEKMHHCLHDNLPTLSLINPVLTALPDYFPPNILKLMIMNTGLTSLPESVDRISPQAEVVLRNNPLTERTLLALRNMIRAHDYSGTQIHFSMHSTTPSANPTRALTLR